MKKLAIIFSISLAFLLVFGSTMASAAAPVDRVKVFIGFDRTPGPAEQALVRSFGGDIKYSYHIFPAIAASVPETAIGGLSKNPHVIVIQPDVEVHAVDDAIPWGIARIGADVVHSAGNTGSGVKVAIIDTGVDYNHSELSSAFGSIKGYDFVNGDTDPMDDNGHGTHVAGIIAADDNDAGIVGVAPGVELYALKVLDSTGSGSFSDIVAALEWATGGSTLPGSICVDITNNSYGSSDDPDYFYHLLGLPGLVETAFSLSYYQDGVLNVAAAGNEYAGEDTVIYPARYDSVIAVAATDQNDNRAYFSSTGPDVELAAPGLGIYSTVPGGYATYSGTSMACPHVVGAAALVNAAHPAWTNEQIRQQLQSTADDLGTPNRDNYYGYGLVDADEAADVPSVNNPPIANDDSATTGEDTSVAIAVLDNDSDPDGDPLGVTTVGAPAHGTTIKNADDTVTYSPNLNYNGTDSFTYTVSDGKGGTASAGVTVIISPVNDPPVAQAQTVSTTRDTATSITLTATDPDGDALTYIVVTNPAHGTLSGTPPGLVYTPAAGYSGADSLTFKANDGKVDSNIATVSIYVEPVEAVLFFDSFENRTFNKWVQDKQKDWFVSTQRATDGRRSAEVDGSANDATLTTVAPINLSARTSATLTFSWYIESSWDSGEYIRLDLFYDGTWHTTAYSINGASGTGSQENKWIDVSITLDPVAFTSDFMIRFTAKVSDPTEDGNLDNVKLVAT